MLQTSKCRQLMGATPHVLMDSALGTIINGGKQMKTWAKCGVSSISRPFPMPSASARLQSYTVKRIYLGTYQKRQKTSVKWWKCGFNRQNIVIFWGFATEDDEKYSALWNNQKWKETNDNLREMVSQVSVGLHVMTSASAGLRPYPIHKGYAPEFVRNDRKLM